MFSNFQVKAAHWAASVGEVKYEKPGGSSLLCPDKTQVSGLYTVANASHLSCKKHLELLPVIVLS